MCAHVFTVIQMILVAIFTSKYTRISITFQRAIRHFDVYMLNEVSQRQIGNPGICFKSKPPNCILPAEVLKKNEVINSLVPKAQKMLYFFDRLCDHESRSKIKCIT